MANHNCKLFNCTCKLNKIHHENNIKKAEIIGKFENGLNHFCLFYRTILDTASTIAFVFAKFLNGLSKHKINLSIEKILRIEININVNCDKILKVY